MDVRTLETPSHRSPGTGWAALRPLREGLPALLLVLLGAALALGFPPLLE